MGDRCKLKRLFLDQIKTNMGVLSWNENYGDEMFQNFNMSKLRMDEAYLNITSKLSKLYLYSVYKECEKCPYTLDRELENGDTLTINTHHPKSYRVSPQELSILEPNSDVICDVQTSFGEFGVYNLNITDHNCSVETLKEPVNIYFPIITVLAIYAVILLVFCNFLYVLRVYVKTPERETTSCDFNPKQSQKRNRVVSLDAFRGISIVLMIFVNFGSGGYTTLEHAVWNGLQLSDLVFPWFLWIMGVCIPISTASTIKRGTSRGSALINITRRSCILFGLGIFLASGRDLETLRIFGVLQRFGVSYLVVATTFMLFPGGLSVSDGANGQKAGYIDWKDMVALKSQWMVAFIVVLVHNLITFVVHAPNCSKGYMGPGGLHENGSHIGCTGGAAGYIDFLILGKHVFRNLEITNMYKADAFDPEGILGCLTTIFQVYIGSQAGATIIFFKGHRSRLVRWMVWGTALGLAGACLCGFSKDDGLIPINKNLWSISFVLVTSSLAFFLFSICYVLIDVKKFWTGKPFVFAGMNAIFMYVGHNVAFNNFPMRWIPNQEIGFQSHFLMLFENIWGTLIWLLLAYQLYRMKVFISV
ncbi:hypothetical protein FQR65_LT14199 [Abscondita terminalis]|nr:hypothetical protein FQR65_LT14199 [Abscondita terminalis]